PNSSGLWRGLWTSDSDGPRSWVTYEEFEQLRDHASVFSAVMATQSSLSSWPVLIDRGLPEEVNGRLVSGGFFQVLGVRPLIGRLFNPAEDEVEQSHAVISHAFWQRRFAGRPDVIGTVLNIRNTVVTIIGVTPAGFVGETSGQLPDLWLPLRLQPRVLPGSDWLRDTPPDKVMWLHLFARLKPGITTPQAEAEANAIFRAGLASFYGTVSDERRAEVLDQRLQIFSGARGASSAVEQFSSSLTVLFASVVILLLIACGNLANLLMARGTARRSEIALRVALGASGGRLVRHLVIESLALAVLGGIVAIGVASLFHGVLVRMLQTADSQFVVNFALDLPEFMFGLAATLGAACVVSLIPALQLTQTDTRSPLLAGGRGTVGSMRESRSGRWLVVCQLALSFPLLVGAGLLARTVYDLQHPDLGFHAERLLLARVSLGELTEDVVRRNRVLRELQTGIEQIPGVEAASFSQLGLFGGGISTSGIEVEGSELTKERARESALDRVGANYFTTLGVPIRLGRDISDSDRAQSPHVCVVNEAFVERYLHGRNPLGMRVTTVGDAERAAYQIVGVVGDTRTQDLRSAIQPRFFVPSEQRGSGAGSRTFIIRVAGDPTMVAAAVRKVVDDADSAVGVSEIVTFEERLASLTAEDRAVARLALVFGIVALTLAAIGLYGILSYGVTRRAAEIAIRMAFGAAPGGIIGMVLRESARLVVAGLCAGGALAYLASQLIANRLHGVEPQDPLTMTVAIGVLVLVALVAAYLPARRASRVDPMATLSRV
ncbi:MAG TPA: ABC transporter permease, partial [Vicinamibacterales bacterium]|nr:ABC transporter permease [Vicinamibacterales bacterium]